MRKNLVFIFITFICLDLFSQGASNNNYDLISKLFLSLLIIFNNVLPIDPVDPRIAIFFFI